MSNHLGRKGRTTLLCCGLLIVFAIAYSAGQHLGVW